MTDRKPTTVPDFDPNLLRDMQRHILRLSDVRPLVRIAQVLMYERLIVKRGGEGISLEEFDTIEQEMADRPHECPQEAKAAIQYAGYVPIRPYDLEAGRYDER